MWTEGVLLVLTHCHIKEYWILLNGILDIFHGISGISNRIASGVIKPTRSYNHYLTLGFRVMFFWSFPWANVPDRPCRTKHRTRETHFSTPLDSYFKGWFESIKPVWCVTIYIIPYIYSTIYICVNIIDINDMTLWLFKHDHRYTLSQINTYINLNVQWVQWYTREECHHS